MKNIWYVVVTLYAFSGFAQQQKYNLLIGTYTDKCDSNGIYIYEFDSNSGQVDYKSNADSVKNPSFLTISSDKKTIYSVNESGSKSTISSFKFDPILGDLSTLNQVNAQGEDPCYIINDDKNVIVANYSSGNITVLKKKSDGSLNNVIQNIQHKGSSKNKERQESSHPHMVQFSPDKKFVFATDLGTDFIYQYTYNPSSENQVLTIKDSVGVRKGSGPRHLTFSPNGKNAYLLNELSGTLIVYMYENDRLRKIEETQVIDDTFHGEVAAADIHISPDGKFLYATNRAVANDITVFEIIQHGKLLFKQFIKTGGISPRNFAIDPTGNFVLIANQQSNNIVIFKRDHKTGRLTKTNKIIEVCQPVCLVFSEI